VRLNVKEGSDGAMIPSPPRNGVDGIKRNKKFTANLSLVRGRFQEMIHVETIPGIRRCY
jgi:hypothetical protein